MARVAADRGRVVKMRSSLPLLALLLALGAFGPACAPQPPVPLVVLENPSTGERRAFFRELWFKVPANYDSEDHLAQWKAEQRAAGFTVELPHGAGIRVETPR